MGFLKKKLFNHCQALSTVALVLIVLVVSWMGYAYGGHFVGVWGPAAFFLAALMLVAALAGVLGGARSWWSVAAVSLFTGYAAWTFLSLLWSSNRGDAWFGAGLTLLYLLGFWLTATFIALGASRSRVLAASGIGSAVIAVVVMLTLTIRTDALFENNRLLGTVGYYNAQAAFFLIPFWVSIYIAGSRRISPVLRGVTLAGSVLGVEVAVLTQSRGALVAMAVSVLIFFLFSGQRLRGLIAVLPVVAILLVAFPGLNEVYLQFLNEGSPETAINQIIPTIWATALAAGLYGAIWGLLDRRWRPSAGLARAAGITALSVGMVVIATGGFLFVERAGSPIAWGQERWEAFRSNDASGSEESRYLSAGGSGRYTLWEVAWRDFTSNPLLGVGTHNYEATFYQEREQFVGHVRQPHNLPLEVLAERGVIGGALFFGFLGVCVAAGVWNRFNNLNSEGKAQVGALLAAASYWFAHSSIEWFWQIPAVTLPAMIYLAMLVAPWERPDDETEFFAPSDRPLRLAGVGIVVLTLATIGPLYVADRIQESASADDNPWVSLEKIENAQTFNPLDPDLARQEADLAVSIGDPPRATQAYARATQLDPEHYAPYAVLGGLYEQLGQPGRALTLYRQALQLSPLDPGIQENLERLEEQRSEEEAEDEDGRSEG